MNLKIVLIFGAGIILSLIVIFSAAFSAFRGPEPKKEILSKKSEKLILQQPSLISSSLPRFQSPEKNGQKPIEQQSIKLKPPLTPEKTYQFQKPKQRLATINNDQDKKPKTAPTEEKKNVVTPETPLLPEKPFKKEGSTKISKEESAVAAEVTQMKIFETQMPQIIEQLLSSVPMSTSTQFSEQEIFEKLWPKEYLENLRQIENLMIQDGFKDANNRNTFATNEDVFKFLDSSAAYLFSKKKLAADKVKDIQSALRIVQVIVKSPLFNLAVQQEPPLPPDVQEAPLPTE